MADVTLSVTGLLSCGKEEIERGKGVTGLIYVGDSAIWLHSIYSF